MIRPPPRSTLFPSPTLFRSAVVVADLPLRSNGRSPIAPMISAIEQTLARDGYRAGTHRVGLLLCDDSTAERGTYDPDRKSTRLNSSHLVISYAVFCLKKKTY